jgi:hypothetical protein
MQCGAKTRTGAPCKGRAMPNGRCRMHSGTNPGRPLIHGRYSLTHRAALHDKMQTFLADPRPGDLTAELALMRALLQDYLERFPDGVALPAMEIERILGMVDAVSRLVERIARIMNQTALTAAEVHLLQARIVDLLVKYVPDPAQRLAFLDELAATVGAPEGNEAAARTIDAE